MYTVVIQFIGAAAFGIAHIMYILAFGFKPLRLPILLGLLPITVYIYNLIYDGLDTISLKLGVFVYTLLITIMIWRALSPVK